MISNSLKYWLGGMAVLLTAVFLVAHSGYPPIALPPGPPADYLRAPYPSDRTDTHPTLADFWHGRAEFILDRMDTGLPMGESDTVVLETGEWWSYLHASDRSAGTIDRCGDPVEFPGCTVIYRSTDNGRTFTTSDPPVCQFECRQCPCDADKDHIPQQQYPRTAYDGDNLWLAYEYLGRTMLRGSPDGLRWSRPQRVAYSGLWSSAEGCAPGEKINAHPYNIINLEQCLAGGPPGIHIVGQTMYIFVGLGQSPGSMGCFYGRVGAPADTFRPCDNNPLFTAVPEYGPLDAVGADANPYWDFRMLSSAEIVPLDGEYYMLYEGLRGAAAGDGGDTQFGLGLARTTAGRLDGPWETFTDNPILVDSPANIGIGHADLVIAPQGETILFTSLDGVLRSRLRLVWVRR